MYHQEKDLINNFIDHAEEYIKTRQEYSKLLAVQKGSNALSSAITLLIIFSIFLCFFLFVSVTIAFLIAEYSGKNSIGFGAVGLFYLLVGVVIYIGKDRLIKIPLMNSLIKNMLKDASDEED